MKKMITASLLLAALVCMLGVPPLAEGGIATPATANASIVAAETSFITAPFAGTLLPFSVREGDRVAADERLFALDTIKVYAPQSGTLGAMFAREGDDADAVIRRYGALCAIEPDNTFYLQASSANAYYNNKKNKLLHVGETLYLKEGNEKGTGVVTGVSQMDYTVEILTGDFNMGSTVKCYRESGYASDSDTGGGQVMRHDDVLVGGGGRVFAVHKRAGDSVTAGELLFEMIDPSSAPDTASLDITAPAAGAVQAVRVLPGAQVYKGQLLCEIADLSRLELSMQMDEVYLSKVSVGSVLTYVFDAFPDRVFQGTVLEIRPLGAARQNAAYFEVRITLPSDASLLPGMNATVTIPLG